MSSQKFEDAVLVYKNSGKFKEAEISHVKSVELNPDSYTNHLNLGVVLKNLKKFKIMASKDKKIIRETVRFFLIKIFSISFLLKS